MDMHSPSVNDNDHFFHFLFHEKTYQNQDNVDPFLLLNLFAALNCSVYDILCGPTVPCFADYLFSNRPPRLVSAIVRLVYTSNHRSSRSLRIRMPVQM